MKNPNIHRVLITGGAGYVGSVLVPHLISKGYHVRVLDLYIYGEHVLDAVKSSPQLEEIKGDIRNQDFLKKSLKDCDAVIHLACISNDPSFELNPVLGREINYTAFLPLIQMSQESGVKRFIFASTSSVYGVSEAENVTEDSPLVPLTDYSKYKGLCEQILLEKQSSDFTTVVVRPATVCGCSPRQRLDLSVNILTNHAITNGQIRIFGGIKKRPNIHIDDVADLYTMLLEAPDHQIAGKIFNAGYQNHSISELAEKVRTVVEKEIPHKGQIELVRVETNDQRSYHISSEKIRKELGYVPKRSIENAVSDLVASFQAGKIPNSMTDDRYYNVKLLQSLKLK